MLLAIGYGDLEENSYSQKKIALILRLNNFDRAKKV